MRYGSDSARPDRLALVTSPRALPISLAEAKLQRRIESSDTGEDNLLTALIRAAVDYAERATRRQLVLATWDAKYDAFPSGPFSLPPSPLRKVASISYLDTAGASQTLATSYYTAFTDEEPGAVRLAYGQAWPATRDIENAVTVRFRAGHLIPFSASGATLTGYDHPFANGDVVLLSTTDGDLPAGLATDTPYYVVSVSGDTLGLSATSGGSAITTTDAGTGTHFLGTLPGMIREGMHLLIGHWYENREDTIERTLAKIPNAADMCFASHSVTRW